MTPEEFRRRVDESKRSSYPGSVIGTVGNESWAWMPSGRFFKTPLTQSNVQDSAVSNPWVGMQEDVVKPVQERQYIQQLGMYGDVQEKSYLRDLENSKNKEYYNTYLQLRQERPDLPPESIYKSLIEVKAREEAPNISMDDLEPSGVFTFKEMAIREKSKMSNKDFNNYAKYLK